jgi:hypothetical protein
VVELRGFGGHDRGMMIGQVDDGGAEHDVPSAREKTGEEHHRRRDRFGGGGEMLAQPQLVEAERVGKHRFFAVLVERAPQRAARRMDRHHEHSQAHIVLPTRDREVLWPVSAVVKMAAASSLDEAKRDPRASRISLMRHAGTGAMRVRTSESGH